MITVKVETLLKIVNDLISAEHEYVDVDITLDKDNVTPRLSFSVYSMLFDNESFGDVFHEEICYTCKSKVPYGSKFCTNCRQPARLFLEEEVYLGNHCLNENCHYCKEKFPYNVDITQCPACGKLTTTGKEIEKFL